MQIIDGITCWAFILWIVGLYASIFASLIFPISKFGDMYEIYSKWTFPIPVFCAAYIIGDFTFNFISRFF